MQKQLFQIQTIVNEDQFKAINKFCKDNKMTKYRLVKTILLDEINYKPPKQKSSY